MEIEKVDGNGGQSNLFLFAAPTLVLNQELVQPPPLPSSVTLGLTVLSAAPQEEKIL